MPIRLNAKPEPIEIEVSSTALLVVDMQNDFGAAGGMFDRAGLDISLIRRVVSPISHALAAAREKGVRIIYLKMGYLPDISDLGSPEAPNRVRHLRFGVGTAMRAPNGAESRILIRDTWNTEILPELMPHAGDVVIYKTRYSGFYQTDLDTILKRFGIKSIIFTGCTTSVCVESTVRDAMFRDYQCVLLSDCTAEPVGHDLPRTNHEASLLVIQTLFGWISDSGELVKAFAAEPAAVSALGCQPDLQPFTPR